jgi:4-carboxymuconolactone decarboxylase
MTWPVQRLCAPDPSTYSPRQQEIHDAIASGPRGGVRGPLAVWLNRAELAAKAQDLGRYCRYDTLLSSRLSELVILTTARIWASEYEWYAHTPHALKAGLAPETVEAIRWNRRPDFSAEDEAVVYDFTRAAHLERKVDDYLFSRAVDVLGEGAVVDLVGIIGYYTLISLTINVFHVSPPEGAPREFEDE